MFDFIQLIFSKTSKAIITNAIISRKTLWFLRNSKFQENSKRPKMFFFCIPISRYQWTKMCAWNLDADQNGRWSAKNRKTWTGRGLKTQNADKLSLPTKRKILVRFLIGRSLVDLRLNSWKIRKVGISEKFCDHIFQCQKLTRETKFWFFYPSNFRKIAKLKICFMN